MDWAGLAVRLGFGDPAHLPPAFAAVAGSPPAAYAKHLSRLG